MIDMIKGDTALIVDECKARGVLRNQCAYVLATTNLETGYTMRPINEFGGNAYFKKMYDIKGDRPSKARELGNLSPGDGIKYHGRGYVQSQAGQITSVRPTRSVLISLPGRKMF